MQFNSSLVALAVIVTLNTSSHAAQQDDLIKAVQLAVNYDKDIDVADYWQSEKLDGIRAIWDGNQLRTRNGKRIYAPDWFTKPLPNYPLEGELWAGRGKFHIVQQTVMDKRPSDHAWQWIDFMLFDIPYSKHNYPQRYLEIKTLVEQIKQQHIKLVIHQPITSVKQLFDNLESIIAKQGEGLMLRHIRHKYQGGRNSDLVKLKKHQDGEGIVVGYKLGKGRFSKVMGALLVQLPSGQQFYLGNGFSEEMRSNPPAIGSSITYRFNGYTRNGVPKFARFLRMSVKL